MELLNSKLESYTMDDVELLIVRISQSKYPIKGSSIKKMYRNWLRNDKEPRNFDIVFDEKHQAHTRKMTKLEGEFESVQVGYLEMNWDEPCYHVHLVGEQSYKVFWAQGVQDPVSKMLDSLDKFCKNNSVKLKQSGQENKMVIQTVFSA